MRKLVSFLFATILVATACTSSRTPSSLPPSPTRDSATTTSKTLGRLAPAQTIYEPGQLEYAIRIQALVEGIPPDPQHEIDSTETTAIATVLFQASPSAIEAIVSLDSTRLMARGNSAQTLANSQFRFTINTITAHVTTTVPRAINCAVQTAETPFSGEEVLPTIPLPLKQRWTDTSHFELCRGGIAVRAQRVSAYQLIEPDSIPRVTRLSDITIDGTGHQWNQLVHLTGTGVAVDTIWLTSSQPMRLNSLRGFSQLQISFRSQLRQQDFRQTALTTIVRNR